MAEFITTSSQFNPGASGLYFEVIPPTPTPSPAATNIIGGIGCGSWGPLNKALLSGSPEQSAYYWGGLSAASLTDPFDIATFNELAFLQVQNKTGIGIWNVRVSDGTDTQAEVDLLDTTSGTALVGATIKGKWTGVRGNELKGEIKPGAVTNTHTFTVLPFTGGFPEIYENIPSNGAGVFWSNLKTALENGWQNRGPSELVVITDVSATAIAPAEGVFSLSGGTDGRAGVTKAELIGQDAVSPRTGAHALIGLSPIVTIFAIGGLADTSIKSDLDTIVAKGGTLSAFSAPLGTSSDAALTTKKSIGADNPKLTMMKDFVRFYDRVNKQYRLVPPTAAFCGLIGTLGPHESPGNKQIYGIVGTERSDLPDYTNIEAGQLENGGVNFICKPIPRGDVFGVRHGQNTSSNSGNNAFENARMENFIINTLNLSLGKYVHEPQSKKASDPVRKSVRDNLNSTLASLEEAGIIDGFEVQCDLKNNPVTEIKKRFLRAKVRVDYLDTIRWFVVTYDGNANLAQTVAVAA